MKRILSVMTFALMSIITASAYDVKVDGIYYNLDTTNKTAEVTNTTGNTSAVCYSGTVNIPSNINFYGTTYSVTSIRKLTFYNCSELTSVTIPSSITSIGYDAFYGCTSLTSITIPNSVTDVGDYAFSGCSGLKSVTLSNSINNIGLQTFYSCSNLTSINIPNSVKNIGNEAFSHCYNLSSITLGNSIEGIGDCAFEFCDIVSLIIPKSVTSIGKYAFACNYSLISITIPNSVINIGDNAFNYCYVCEENIHNESSIDLESKGLILADDRQEDGLVIKDNCVVYCDKKAISVTIPNNVTSIKEGAFANNCDYLNSITIGSSLTNINEDIFKPCSNHIEKLIFAEGCKSTIRTYLTSINSLTIPNTVTSIGEGSFYGCSKLTSIYIPNSVTNIGSQAFCNCSSINSLILPSSVTNIGSMAFCYCSGLNSITIPNSVTSIGSYAFNGCFSLSSITLPESVINIGNNAFSSCSKLTDFYCYQVPAPILSGDIVSNYSIQLHVRKCTLNSYKGSDYWKKFTNITGEALVLLSDINYKLNEGKYYSEDVEYTRTGSAIVEDKYGSFCLPFDIDLAATDCFKKVYVPMELSFYNTSTNLLSLFMKIVDASSVVKAGTPFIAVLNGNPVVLDNSSDVTFTDSYDNPTTKQLTVFDFDGAISGALLEDEDITLEWGGTYKKTSPYDTMYSFKTNGNFGTQTSALNPFRAFIVKKEKSSAAKVAGIQAVFSDEDATGIEELMSQVSENIKQPVKVYTIDGRLVGTGTNKDAILRGLSKGVYIMNGKKIFK